MSSSNRRTSAIAVIALLAMSVVLGACGFRPLYGQGGPNASTGPGSSAELTAVEVKPIADRAGQMMRTALQRRLGLKGVAPAQYQLSVSLKEGIAKLAVEQNAFATRANLSLTATYQLVRIHDGRQLASGKPRAVASYNILDSDYATLVAEADARERAIETLANDIHARLAIYFSGPGTDEPDAARGISRP